MQNIVGQIASKENFYPRKREINRIARNLEAGSHIQLSAPRRVGKSSILVHLKDNPLSGFVFMYIDVESARTKKEFYYKLYRELLRNETLTGKKKLLEQLQDKANKYFQRLKNIQIAGVEIGLNEKEEVDYEEELLNFLSGIDISGERLVIMVDEFPEVLLNMLEDDKGDISNARAFLQSNREFRNAGTIRGRIQFIYTGSSSLNVTATMLGSTELINDLTSCPVNPLSETEAADLVISILRNYGYQLSDENLAYLIQLVEWRIPFYFQLIVHELLDQVEPGTEITAELISKALQTITHQRNDHHFEHYAKRLKRVFKEKEYYFVKALLLQLCKKDSLTTDEVINIGYEIVSETRARQIIQSLEADGYILQVGTDATAYKFSSPILKNWWFRHES